MSALFGTKNVGSSEIYGVGLSQCGYFRNKRGGGGQFFAILFGRLLWTAPISSVAIYTFFFNLRRT